MKRSSIQGATVLIAGVFFSLGILAALLLPNILIVVLLTLLLLLSCVILMK